MAVESIGALNRLQGRAGDLLYRCWKLRDVLLAGVLGLWVGGFWIAEDGWYHRRGLWVAVPFIVLAADRIVGAVSEVRWLWVVALLLGWQSLSRLWATPPPLEVGGVVDACAVLGLAAGCVVIGRTKALGFWVVGGLAILGAVVVVYSLVAFYGSPARDLGVHRLRNMLVYEEGLNAVLTGMLCAAGAVAGAWFTLSSKGRAGKILWAVVLGIFVFGVMASQSRGPILGLMAGLGVIFFFKRRASLRVGLIVGGAAGVYFLLTVWTAGSGEVLERGSTGRLAIYQWYVERISGLEFLFGRGFGTDSSIPAEELGWFVHHPHSSYLTQLVLGGALGVVLLLAVLAWSWHEAWRQGTRGECLWAALLGCGLITLLVDGAEIFTLHSVPRLEWLMVAFPAALAVGRSLEERPAALRGGSPAGARESRS